MPYYEFKPNDLFLNTIEAYPNVSFYGWSGSVYINDENYISGTYSDNITGVPRGFISLYEYNINRDTGQQIYPYVVKGGNKASFKSISDVNYNTQYQQGDQITSSYNLSASISRHIAYLPSAHSNYTDANRKLRALANTLNYYRYISPHYDFDTYYSGSLLNMIDIPSIFYGSSIKKGSVSLKQFFSGTLIAQCADIRHNGELIQVTSSDSSLVPTGSVVGTVLYNEGFILLTSSANLCSDTYRVANGLIQPKWLYFGLNDIPVFNSTASYSTNLGTPAYNPSRHTGSVLIEFQGTTHTQTMTMFAKAPYAEVNNSNNPTYLDNANKSLERTNASTGSTPSYIYDEGNRVIKNIVHTNYTEVPPFEKTTYISKVALYDKNKNLIGIAKLATPVLKTEDREFIFKLKLDL